MPADRNEQFVLNSDPFATASHIPATVRDEPSVRKPMPHFPDIPNHTDFEVIGRGGMGTVYKAIQRPTDRAVAVKVINHFSTDSKMRDRFINEVRAHARIRHPGVIPIYEVGDCSHGPYFTMEYQPGGTLAKRLKEGMLDDREAVRIVAEAAEAVHAAHLEGIVHRDIKPSNILVDASGRVRLTDFGLAKHAAGDDITQLGIIVGTFAYMSPEQAAGDPRKIGAPADIYCLGATLFQLLTGRVAHPSKGTDFATVKDIAHGPSPIARSVRPDLCDNLDAVIQRSMAHNPADRYPSAADFARDLRRWLANEPTDAKPLTRGQKAWRRFRLYRSYLIVAIGILILVGVAIVVKREREEPAATEWALARGETVTFVPETGRPQWHQWMIGDVVLTDSTEGDRTAGFQTHTNSALVLVRDPMSEHYRFRAELRHDSSSTAAGSLGVFFGTGSAPSTDGTPIEYWHTVEYSEYWNTLELKRPELRARHGAQVASYLEVNRGRYDSSRMEVVPRHPFVPNVVPPVAWRKIRLDIGPDGVQVYWGDTGPDAAPVIRITKEKLESALAEHFDADPTKFLPTDEARRTSWNPRTKLGIFASQSAISMKNVSLEPLRDSK